MRWPHTLLVVLVTSAALAGPFATPSTAQEPTPEAPPSAATPTATPTPSQDPWAEYVATYTDGITAIQEERYDEGVAAFERCLELSPEDERCAYNLACAYALRGELDSAFQWLTNSAAWGLGNDPTQRLLLFTDPDLADMRRDGRFEQIVASVRDRRAALAAYAAQPELYLPPSLADAESVPLLVVLHDYGETKQSVINGPWRAVADRLGLALLAPSGPIGAAADPADGMGWFVDPENYSRAPWVTEQPANDAVEAFRAEHSVDRTRVYIAGRGQGGTVALHMALFGPGFYRGVLSLDGDVVDSLVPAVAPDAARLGLAISVLIDDADGGATPWVRDLQQRLTGWSLAGQVGTWTGSEQDLVATAAEALMALGASAP